MARPKKLRFAGLVRVSTEPQRKKGESLETQTNAIQHATAALGASVTKWYKGDEHATAGYERKLLDALLADAQKARKPFNAVMVYDPSRWSRDNVKSTTGLDLLRDNGVLFFCQQQEFNLHDEQARLYLALNAVFGGYQVDAQIRKAMESKIARAKQGRAAVGKLPWGRTWDAKTGAWGVVPECMALVEDCAARYLAGESIANLAAEYGLGLTHLHNILMNRCGPVWVCTFTNQKLGIDDRAEVAIPPLLPPETIAALHKRRDMQKKYVRGANKNQYLLAQYVRCANCGKAVSPQSTTGHRYYRPTCGCYHGSVSADALEGVVLAHLLETFGNVAALAKAAEAAIPNQAKTAKLAKQKAKAAADLDKLKRARAKHLKALELELVPEDEIYAKLGELKERENLLQERVAVLAEHLADVPTPEDVHGLAAAYAEWSAAHKKPETWEEKRDIVEAVFKGTSAAITVPQPAMQPAGAWPCGVYVQALPATKGRHKRPWKYTMYGQALAGLGGRTDNPLDVYRDDGTPCSGDFVSDKRCTIPTA